MRGQGKGSSRQQRDLEQVDKLSASHPVSKGKKSHDTLEYELLILNHAFEGWVHNCLRSQRGQASAEEV